MFTFDSIADRRFKGFRDFEGLKGLEFHEIEEPEFKSADFAPKGQELFDMIFSIDPVTNLPSGDLSVFMNDNTSPEVRQYITQNLMRDVSSSAAPSVQAKDVDEFGLDNMVELSRHSGESLNSYRDRMIAYIKENSSSDSNGE